MRCTSTRLESWVLHYVQVARLQPQVLVVYAQYNLHSRNSRSQMHLAARQLGPRAYPNTICLPTLHPTPSSAAQRGRSEGAAGRLQVLPRPCSALGVCGALWPHAPPRRRRRAARVRLLRARARCHRQDDREQLLRGQHCAAHAQPRVQVRLDYTNSFVTSCSSAEKGTHCLVTVLRVM